MDIIKKRINLETYKNHTPSYFPYITVYDDGKWRDKSDLTTNPDAIVIPGGEYSKNKVSWGNVLCDMPELSASTSTLLRHYFEINAILRTGIKMKRMHGDSGVVLFVEKYDDVVRSYDYTVSNIEYLKAKKPGIYEVISGDVEGDFIIFLSDENYKRYEDIGGSDFISYVEDNVLGLIKVEFAPGSVYEGETIEGDLVPEKFYISAIQKWLDWFNENIPGKNDDCNCYESEWYKRGGDKMKAFLEENLYRLDKYQNTTEVAVPVLSIPLLLTQNYDDNGVMSVYDEETQYKKKDDTGRTPYEEYYDTSYEPEFGIKTESRLDTLRSNIKMFDDNGNLLPYIDVDDDGNGYLPYRVGEGFNISYDEDSGEYVADYIKSIKVEDGHLNNEIPLDDNGDQLPVGYTTTIEFEYVIGGAYSQNKKISIKNNIDTVPPTSSITMSAITITADEDEEWVILSNGSLFAVEPSAGTGSQTLNLCVMGINTSKTDDRLLTIVASTKGRIHDEVMCTIKQEHNAPTVSCSFNSTLPNTITASSTEITKYISVLCNGSDWYLDSLPDFVTASPMVGKDGVNTRVLLTFDELSEVTDAVEGKLVFVATDNSNVTYEPIVRHGDVFPESCKIAIGGGPTISAGEEKEVIGVIRYSDGTVSQIEFNSDWAYRVKDSLYANYIVIYTDANNKLWFKNNNTRTQTMSVSVEIYNKNMLSLSSVVTAKMLGVLS